MNIATLDKQESNNRQQAGSAAATNIAPALLADRLDLSKLRYDYPLILVSAPSEAGAEFVCTLSDIIDQILRQIALPSAAGEELRSHVLRLETEIRTLVSQGSSGSLRELWDAAAGQLVKEADDGEALQESFDAARKTLKIDGEIIGCDGNTPTQFLRQAWAVVHEDRTQKFRLRVNRLIVQLIDILHADYHKSDAAREPDSLERSLGAGYESVFDFAEMSRILESGAPRDSLSENRRQRVQATLDALESQKFFSLSEGTNISIYEYGFDSCKEAVDVFQQRLPEMIALTKAIAIADLEIENTYNEAIHDSYFDRFDEASLSAPNLAMFPPYLVCLSSENIDDALISEILGVLPTHAPIKILFQTDRILPEPTDPQGPFSTGVNHGRLATMALGVNTAYVLQAGNASLYQLRDAIVGGLNFEGPSLFSVFSGVTGAETVPPYLISAAATESRAFPIFTFDPAAGSDWATRFRIDDNPQADLPWPVHHLEYEDQKIQRISEDVIFTLADFAACDDRYAEFFENLPLEKYGEDLVSMAVFLEREGGDDNHGVPFVAVVDGDYRLHRMLVNDRLVQAARECAGAWRSLQELGGIDNSHARILVDREREVWEQENRPDPASNQEPADSSTESLLVGHEALVVAEPEPAELIEDEPASDDPYIETPRCTTCNECTQINNRMFAYNENMQAYIADPDAGTFKELVDAAESCQVCIIHPGKPRNPDEENLSDLMARAEEFA